MQTRSRLALAAALAVAALPVVSASAADKPAPGCAGMAFSDAAGDAVSASSGGPAASNMDVLGGYFLDDGATVTANIQVADLEEKVPSGATGADWYLLFQQGNATNFVHASIDVTGGDPVFSYGHIDPTNGVLTDDGTSSGQFFNGQNGVIQIALPGNLASGTLAGPYAQADEATGVPGVGGALSTDDQAPDSGGGTDYTVGSCSGAAAPAAPIAPATAAQAPGSSQPAAPAASAPTMKVVAKNGSARKISKTRRLVVALQSTGPVSGITGTLVDAKGKTVASGKLAQLNGKGSLTLRLRKALKKGRYTLRIKSSSGAVSAAMKLTR